MRFGVNADLRFEHPYGALGCQGKLECAKMVRLAISSAESTGRVEEIVHNSVRNHKVVFEGLGYL